MTYYQIILNPVSGRGNGEKIYPQLEAMLQEKGVDFAINRTEYPGHAIILAEQAALAGSDVVVAVGGDGTANEVLNGLIEAQKSEDVKAALGLIPVGRGNDFAYSVGIPTDFQKSVEALIQNHQRWIDVGLVVGGDYPQGRHFGNGVGIGFDAVVGFEALKLKRLSGFPSYIVAALKTIFLYFHAPLLRIEYGNPETRHQVDNASLMVSIMNGIRLGGGFMMAPKGAMNDGLFDLTIAGQVSRLEIFRLIFRFLKGSQAGHPAIQITQAAKVNVTALQGFLPAHADGETLCTTGKRLELTILPGKIKAVVPIDE
jgi:diacylglycerol kinase (ATP)